MIITKLIGGIGNQMFQYAAGLALARKHDVNLKMDIMFLEDRSTRYYRHTHRDYALDVFRISGSVARKEEIARFTVPRFGNKYVYHLKKRMLPHHNVFTERETDFERFLNIPDDAYIEGYWQDARYVQLVANRLKKEFTSVERLPQDCRDMLAEIRKNEPVCCIFRRGDFVDHPVLDLVDLSFYGEALRRLDGMLSGYTLFVFSDDIPWCRDNFKPGGKKVVFVDQALTGPKAQYYLQLIMACRHFIIPNSTYAWWGAWLSPSPGKMVFAPAAWYKGQAERRNRILPDEWQTI